MRQTSSAEEDEEIEGRRRRRMCLSYQRSGRLELYENWTFSQSTSRKSLNLMPSVSVCFIGLHDRSKHGRFGPRGWGHKSDGAPSLEARKHGTASTSCHMFGHTSPMTDAA